MAIADSLEDLLQAAKVDDLHLVRWKQSNIAKTHVAHQVTRQCFAQTPLVNRVDHRAGILKVVWADIHSRMQRVGLGRQRLTLKYTLLI